MQSAFSCPRGDTEKESEEPSHRGIGLRRKREFTPEEKKDASYWEKRRKNNEAAKRSREKRRANDFMLETRLVALSDENAALRAELLALNLRYGLLNSNCPYSSHQRSFLQMHSYFAQTSNTYPDRELWEREKVSQGPSQWPGYQQTSETIAANYGANFATHSFPINRAYSYLPDVPGFVPSTSTPMVLAPVFPPLAASFPEIPVLHPVGQRTTIHKEVEQQPPANGSTTLPHKLRLKNPRSAKKKEGRISPTSSFSIYLSS
ncbi:nuclear factor, interleukin 3 regulated, member 4 [Neoarius graeffei]|uniref:nuclear factor, interleukin 3 regulated, member 4 n=1 Tax=Neoarius graeffei TaxID=443677 RepID=UPI00298C3F91|nr:nuclear factor, interleukin 3 regulated, member 4 [Neoarius graeffei]XP_060796607.1 nuclear factor, interleukin 3 regulated, member 4 [Neoarius graeffei]